MRENIESSRLQDNSVIRERVRSIYFADATAGNITYSAAQVIGGFIVRDPGAGNRTDVFPTAALLVAALPGAAVGQGFDFTIINNAAGANTVTLTLGTGGTFGAAARTHVIAQNDEQTYRFNLTNVTLGSEAYTVFEK